MYNLTTDEELFMLGYKKMEYYDKIYYLNDSNNIEIVIKKDTQEIIIQHSYYYDGMSYEQKIGFQELKLINKKIEELG